MKHFNCKPTKSNVDVKETVKVAEITDPYGNLRYKIALLSRDIIDDGKYIPSFSIQVINHFGVPQPIIIVDRPDTSNGEADIYDYNYAISIYCHYVKSYTNLVKSESKDHQSIDIYKENVGYEKTTPKCCATCKWARKRLVHKDFIFGVSDKLECTNPENCYKYEMNMHEAHTVHRYHHDERYGHHCRHDDFSHNTIYPMVDPFGVCENYFKLVLEQVPVPGQSITNFIDMRIGSQLDDRIEQAVEREVKEEISEEVDKALSAAFNNANLSVVIKDHVDNVIQSEEVENKIADIVEDNLTIGSITGNKGIKKFTDTNNNGMQDSNEPDVPDTEEIVVLGDMGA